MMRKCLSWAIVAAVFTFAIGSSDAEAGCRRWGRRCWQNNHGHRSGCASGNCHTFSNQATFPHCNP